MSQDSNSRAYDNSNGATSSTDPWSSIDLHDVIWEEIDDPIEKQILKVVKVKILTQLAGGSN